MSGRWDTTIHLGYIKGELVQASIHEGAVSDVARRVMLRHAPDAVLVSRTYPLGESAWPMRLVYECEVVLRDDGSRHPWRHEFRRPDEPWSMAPLADLTDTIGGRQ